MSDYQCRGSYALGTACQKCSRCVGELKQKLQTLQKENAKLRECVEFYANERNWSNGRFARDDMSNVIVDYSDNLPDVGNGGKKARETLVSINKGYDE